MQTNAVSDSYGILEWTYCSNGEYKQNDDSGNYFGFLLEEANQLLPPDFSLNTDYIGPFRKLPERSYSRYENCGVTKFGIHGENSYSFLIQDSLNDRSLSNHVSNWYKTNFSGWEVNVNKEKAPFYQIDLQHEGSSVGINIKDVGQGMSQALPLVTRAMMPVEDDTLIILEQPELHLHPAAHGNLAELFVKSVQEDPKKKYLIETHSQNFLLRTRYLVANGILDCDDLKIYSVEFDVETGISHLVSIDVDNEGNVSFWPEGIFNESFEEARNIARMQNNK